MKNFQSKALFGTEDAARKAGEALVEAIEGFHCSAALDIEVERAFGNYRITFDILSEGLFGTIHELLRFVDGFMEAMSMVAKNTTPLK